MSVDSLPRDRGWVSAGESGLEEILRPFRPDLITGGIGEVSHVPHEMPEVDLLAIQVGFRQESLFGPPNTARQGIKWTEGEPERAEQAAKCGFHR